ncbi:MAG TPA: DUF1844 domain-containing protein [Candidatus Aquilonibacter sp.]|nr:DUF1844 domain-containing protein [Candidatus Aquilonibacter sp.]
MPDKTPFVVNDRRKFTAEGELRPDVPHNEPEQEDSRSRPASAQKPEPPADAKAPIPFPSPAAESPAAQAAEPAHLPDEDHLPPPPTVEQTEQANRAYAATVDRLDTAIRATNPGMERMPEMNYEHLVQSLYMQALLQLGGATEPGQPARVDLLGARQTIDMLTVIAEKTKGNLTDAEDKLTQSALFELRMGFLEVTQGIARQSAKQGAPGASGMPGAPGGPTIVR